MAKILDHKKYEIVHPKTGDIEVWNGARIKAYQITYKADVNFPDPPVKKVAKRTVKNKDNG